MKIKTTALDNRFSLLVRTLADWKCQRCEKDFTNHKRGLQASHYYGRRAKSVRYDLENTDALCFICHQWFEEHPAEYVAWKIPRLGLRRYRALQQRFNGTVKFNAAFKRETRAWIEEMLKAA